MFQNLPTNWRVYPSKNDIIECRVVQLLRPLLLDLGLGTHNAANSLNYLMLSFKIHSTSAGTTSCSNCSRSSSTVLTWRIFASFAEEHFPLFPVQQYIYLPLQQRHLWMATCPLVSPPWLWPGNRFIEWFTPLQCTCTSASPTSPDTSLARFCSFKSTLNTVGGTN